MHEGNESHNQCNKDMKYETLVLLVTPRAHQHYTQNGKPAHEQGNTQTKINQGYKEVRGCNVSKARKWKISLEILPGNSPLA